MSSQNPEKSSTPSPTLPEPFANFIRSNPQLRRSLSSNPSFRSTTPIDEIAGADIKELMKLGASIERKDIYPADLPLDTESPKNKRVARYTRAELGIADEMIGSTQFYAETLITKACAYAKFIRIDSNGGSVTISSRLRKMPRILNHTYPTYSSCDVIEYSTRYVTSANSNDEYYAAEGSVWLKYGVMAHHPLVCAKFQNNRLNAFTLWAEPINHIQQAFVHEVPFALDNSSPIIPISALEIAQEQADEPDDVQKNLFLQVEPVVMGNRVNFFKRNRLGEVHPARPEISAAFPYIPLGLSLTYTQGEDSDEDDGSLILEQGSIILDNNCPTNQIDLGVDNSLNPTIITTRISRVISLDPPTFLPEMEFVLPTTRDTEQIQQLLTQIGPDSIVLLEEIMQPKLTIFLPEELADKIK